MMNIVNFGASFSDNMATHVKNRIAVSDCVFSHKTPASGQNKAQATDCRLWDVVRGLYNHGKYTIAIGYDSGLGYAELINHESPDETQMAKISEKKGEVHIAASIINQNGGVLPYDGKSGKVILAAFIAYLYQADGEIQSILSNLEPYTSFEPDADVWGDAIIAKEVGTLLNTLSQNLYYTEKDLSSNLSQNISQFRVADIKKTGEKVKMLFGQSKNAKPESKKPEVSKGQFSLSPNRVYSDEEMAMIPQMPSSYVFPEWVLSTAEEIKESSSFAGAVRNILLIGPAGTGKTKGSQALASLLNLPYVKITCSPDSDMFDIIGQMLPNVDENDTEDVRNMFQTLSIPTFDDVENDYVGTYQKLFGKEPDKYSSASDCYNEILRLMLAGIKKNKSDFTYVESDFIKGIRNGYLIEMQEPTIIKRSSVLVGLNAIMENDPDTSYITLPTGKVIKRHPDAVVVMTTNSDYAGCNKIQQSVLSRVDCVRKIGNPGAEVMAERTMKATGFSQKTLLLTMARIIEQVNSYCMEKDISDGVCGPRELLNWAKKAILLQKKEDGTDTISIENIVNAAFSTVIFKMAQTDEDIEEILTSVFAKEYDQFLLANSKEMYLNGVI